MRHACGLGCVLLLAAAGRGQSAVRSWGPTVSDSGLAAATDFVDVACGVQHVLGIRTGGAVVAFGDNSSGQCDVPPLPAGIVYVQVTAGRSHAVALRSDGSVVAWGDNSAGQ